MKLLIPGQILFPLPDAELPIWITASGQEVLEPGWKLNRKIWNNQTLKNNQFLLMVTRRGLGWFIDQDKRFHCQKQGDYLLLESSDDFTLFAPGDNSWEILYVFIECQNAFSLLNNLKEKFGSRFQFGLNCQIFEHMARIFRSQEVGYGGDQYQISQSAYETLMEWYRSASRKEQYLQPSLLKAEQYIKNNGVAFSLNEWAEELKINTYTLFTSLEENYGFSPSLFNSYLEMEYLLKLIKNEKEVSRKNWRNFSVNKKDINNLLSQSFSIDIKKYSSL